MKSIAVVGANLAGGRAVESLRQAGFDGRITLIGEEPWRPYERPPLSKEVLWDPANVPDNSFLHDEAWYAANRIEMRLGTRAEALDLAMRIKPERHHFQIARGAAPAQPRHMSMTGG